jgi:glutathione S-transferase
MPFKAMPILEVDGQVIAQSNTINRYVGKLTGLYPKDDWQAALVDELMDAIEDITVEIERQSRSSPRPRRRRARSCRKNSYCAISSRSMRA